MCFSMHYKVEHVENPDVVKSFDVFSVPDQTVSEDQARNMVDTAIRLWLDNQIVKAVLDEAAKFDNNVTHRYGDPFTEVPERTVLFTTPIGQCYLHDQPVHDELMYVTHDMRMERKIIALQFKDFGFVVMYSIAYSTTPKAYIHADVRLKFGIAAESITVYNCEAGPVPDV